MGLELGETRWVLLDVLAVERRLSTNRTLAGWTCGMIASVSVCQSKSWSGVIGASCSTKKIVGVAT